MKKTVLIVLVVAFIVIVPQRAVRTVNECVIANLGTSILECQSVRDVAVLGEFLVENTVDGWIPYQIGLDLIDPSCWFSSPSREMDEPNEQYDMRQSVH